MLDPDPRNFNQDEVSHAAKAEKILIIGAEAWRDSDAQVGP
jgi:hypothetical protein